MLLSASALAEPYFLSDSHISRRDMFGNKYAIDIIASKQSLPFDVTLIENGEERKVENEQSPVNVTQTYQSWFKNLKDRIEEEKRTEFDSIMDIIDFGSSEKVAVPRTNMPIKDSLQVTVLSKNDPYWQGANTRGFVGMFIKNGTHMQIYVQNDYHTPAEEILLHEIGHSLGIADSYSGGTLPKDVKHGSDKRDTVMDKSKTLTCDDADALAGAIYLAAKKQNPNQPDLEFESFCKKEDGTRIKLRNAKQLNRRPVTIVSDGKYYITDFCENGEIKTSLQINPREAQPITITTENECPSAEFQNIQPEVKLDETKKNFFVDLTKKRKNKINPDANTVIYEYAPSLVREITFNNEVSQTMVKVKNEDGALLYVFAILDEKRAFAASIYDRIMLIYDMKDYKKYTLQEQGKIYGAENHSDAKEIMDKLKNYIDKDRRKVTQGSFTDTRAYTSSYIPQAVRWQGYLHENYPQKSFKLKKINIDEKELKEFSKEFKAKFNVR